MNIISGGPFISEIHYDNDGADTGEFIEVCAPPDSDITGFTIELYNGNGGGVYDTITIDPATAMAGADGNTYYVVSTPGIQNGAPDGIALVNASGAACEFISYEGTLVAADGAAAGMTSTDIGAAEGSATAAGTSIQIQPDGTWIAGLAETPNEQNICFLENTGILTENGYLNIESLKIGDLVKTKSGKSLPVKWIGIQTVDVKMIANPLNAFPVLIKKDAIDNNVPSRDLNVSPNHAIEIDGLLINAGALVNGVNILQLNPTESFKYYHIELDSHELVIAENTPTESYLPQNENRANFDNSDEFDQQYPDGRKILLWPLDLPRVNAQSKVPNFIKDKILKKEAVKYIA